MSVLWNPGRNIWSVFILNCSWKKSVFVFFSDFKLQFKTSAAAKMIKVVSFKEIKISNQEVLESITHRVAVEEVFHPRII